MNEFEKLGVFYLGKEYDMKGSSLKDDLVLLKSKDLTTHAVIIGMTGSGKTGLGIGMIEEAALDNIPVIAIDPKGDLTNLALAFPGLSQEEFRPWINLQEASNKGKSPDEYALDQANMWKKGLKDWGQDGKRIEAYQKAANVTIYTPGGSGGVGVSVLKSFKAPSDKIIKDNEAFNEKINITTVSILSLIGITAESFINRESILIANILENAWRDHQDLALEDLILAIQNPTFDKVGVMTLESFYPAKERFELAIMLNNLLASPSFSTWLNGVDLDIDRFLYDENGKAQISVFTISHLNDDQRMFFVTMLLNEMLSWTRMQSGTGSLRAMLYMDELYGYLPPIANPPSKQPLLTLLKQARAFGLGLVLSTQNPVDLDYKALSNAGTWFIGRLQTQRDKERVMAGLEGSAVSGIFDKDKTEKILSGLGKRVFYLHSVHDDKPKIFTTRWVLSYLAGPLTKDQISMLPKNTIDRKDEMMINHDQVDDQLEVQRFNKAPVLPSMIKQVFLPSDNGILANMEYQPYVLCIADVIYKSTKYNVATSKNYCYLVKLENGLIALDWQRSYPIDIDINDLNNTSHKDIPFGEYPSVVSEVKKYDEWERLFIQFAKTALSVNLLSSPSFKVVGEIGEDQRDFKIRLQHIAHEQRDNTMNEVRRKYEIKLDKLKDKQNKALQALDKKSALASQKKMDAALSAGGAILGALFGRKITTTSINQVRTAVRSTSRALSSGKDIDIAQDTVEGIEEQIKAMNMELEQELAQIAESYEIKQEEIESIMIRPNSSDINVRLIALAWKAEAR